MAQTLGFDISFWQDNNSTPQMVDFEKAKTNGIRFAFIKASQSTWLDQDFVLNWASAKRSGLLRGAYHFYTWDKLPEEQALFFAGVLKNDPGELPPVLDFEYRPGAPDDRTRSAMYARMFLEVVKRELKMERLPILYTSPGYWREFGTPDSYWREYPLWLAHYTNAPAPLIPAPWTSYSFWQFTSHGDGPRYGTESLNVDLNWFNGSEEDLYRFAGQQPGEKPVGQCMKVTSQFGVRVRSGPSEKYSILGQNLKPGETVEVIEKFEQVWVRHERGWSCAQMGDLPLMEKVEK